MSSEATESDPMATLCRLLERAPGWSAVEVSTGGLRLEGISKSYRGVTALDEVSLVVKPGDVQLLVGPNASGKTTLGRVAVGLTDPDRGEIDGPVDGLGYAFQDPRYYPSLTVEEHLRTVRAIQGSERVAPEWSQALAEALRLDRVAHQPAAELSGGFQKKLDIAIGLLARPRYVWLDEPLADLDELSVDRIVRLVEAYREAGGAVIIGTHHPQAFLEVATQVTLFRDGCTRGPIPIQQYDPERSIETYFAD